MSFLGWLTPDEWEAVRLSLSVAARSVVFGLPLAVLAAYALARGRFVGRPVLDALVHLPLVVPGGSVWSQRDADNLARFAERWGLPVAVPFRRQHMFDNRLPNYAGDLGVGMNPKLGEALKASD